MKKLAIIIVNWNSISLTTDTLKSLQKAEGKFDIIVVDNGSSNEEGINIKLAFPDIILIESETNLGFTGGNNLGLQYALNKNYELVMMLNNDVEVEPNFLLPLLDKMDKNSKIGAIQPLIYFHHDRQLIWNAGGKYLKILGISKTINAHSRLSIAIDAKSIDWITGCAFMVRTKILQSIGLLEEKFFIYHEDVDLSFRIRNTGYELWIEPLSIIYHIAGMANKSLKKSKEGFVSPKVHFLNARNQIWVLKKYTQPIFWPSVFVYHFLYSLLISLYFILRIRFVKLKAWWKGIEEGMTYSI